MGGGLLETNNQLERFTKNKRSKKLTYSVLGILLIIGSLTIFKTFAFFEEKQEFNVIKGKIPSFVANDITIAYTIDGEKKSSSFPNKEDGYRVSQVVCENGVTARWDHSTWSLEEIKNNNNEKIKCQVDFITPNSQGTLIDYIENLAKKEELISDETIDKNLRYIGKNPNNYIWFNNELWRIIGVMNNIKNIYGESKSRIKIIREKSIGNFHWDNKSVGILGTDSEYGNNDWSTSTLQNMLNNASYYNRESRIFVNGTSSSQDFTKIGLTNEAKSMIDTVIWDVGGTPKYLTTLNYYLAERGDEVYEGRPTKWIGNVGLIYPSDYGLATSGGETVNRETCINLSMDEWNESLECPENNWILKSQNQRTLTPVSSNSTGTHVIAGSGSGAIFHHVVKSTDPVYPVVYLKSDIHLVEGNGTQDSPYKIKNN